MNAKQARFVAEYLIDLNGTQAAIRAGYSAKSASVHAVRMLANDKVRTAVEAGQAKMAASVGVTAERVVTELAKLGFSNMQDYMKSTADGDPYLDFSNLTRDQAAALSEVTVEDFKDGRSDQREVRRVKFKLADKRAALVDLGKHLGMFVDRSDNKTTVALEGSAAELLKSIAENGTFITGTPRKPA